MTAFTSVASVAIPGPSRIRNAYARTDLADAFEVRLPDGAARDPETLARFIFGNLPGWVMRLMRVRDRIVRHLGLKTGDALRRTRDRRIGLFRVFETTPAEIVLGEDDSHLDFRVSVLSRSEAGPAGGASFVVVSTVVRCNNRLGRIYILVVAPFHRTIVKAGLRRAARLGWPTQILRDPP